MIKEIDALGNSTSYTYSPGGKLTSVLDAMGNRTEYGYDKAGRLATIYRHEGSRELLSCIEDEERKHSLKEISKIKEKYGRQIPESLKEANVLRITRYKRNLMGDVECITNAFGEEEYFSYDLLGRVILKKDMDGYETRYSYTKARDIKTVLYADGYKAEYEYDSLGKLTKVKDALGFISIENDKLGRTTKVIDHDSKEVRYSYGKFGERLKTIYPDKKSIEYGYDEDLRLVSFISGDKEIRYSYDKEGRLIRKDMPDEISSLYSYDERGLLSSLCHMKGDKKLEEYIYGYDLLGNKTKVVRQRDVDHKGIKEDKNKEKIIHKLWEDSSTFNYEYDSLSRLVAVKRGEKEVCRYAYDAFGNRIKMKKDGIEAVYTYDALDRLVKINSLHTNESYEYDKRGNLVGVMNRGKKIKAYEYGASGRLGLSYSNLGKARSYDYDGMGNRIGCREYKFESKGLEEDRLKSINELDLAKKEPVYEERYVLDRTRPYNNMLQRSILDRGKEQTQSYAWDFNAVFMEEEEKVYTYLNDELGSTIRLLEKEGKSQTIYGYDEFGKETYGTQGQVQPFGYTGYRYDAVAETYFAQAREYVAGVGRFGGKDWIKGSISYPTSLNAYGYCYGNSLVWVDMDGLLPETVLPGVPFYNPIEEYKKLEEEAKQAYAQQRIDVPAPVFPPRDSSMPDYTAAINDLLKKEEKEFAYLKVKGEVLVELQKYDVVTSLINPGVPVVVKVEKVKNDIGKLIAFADNMRPNGPMDLKQPDIWKTRFAESVPQVKYFIFNDEVMDAATLGNVAYGYVGTYLGFSETLLYQGGGIVNVKNLGVKYLPVWNKLPNYGEAPEDIIAIKKGIDLYNSRKCTSCD